METIVYAVETLYHLKNERDYVQTVLSSSQEKEFVVSVNFAASINFDRPKTQKRNTFSGLHEAMNVYRESYVTLLQKGYSYWGLIPLQRIEAERTTEKKRLLRLVEDYCHTDALHALREWRDTQAQAENYRPSTILSDRTLRSLATFLPQNDEELAYCPGIGEDKQNRYDYQLLQICSRYERRFQDPLYSLLPKYKQKVGEEERFLTYQGERLPVKDPIRLREKALLIGKTGLNVNELASLSRVDDRETRRRVASAANKLRMPHVTRSIRHLLFDEGPQVRQYALRAVLSSKLRHELAGDVSRLLEIEPKSYNQSLCKRILNPKSGIERFF